MVFPSQKMIQCIVGAIYIHIYTGWWYTYPFEKHESVGMMIIPNMMGKNVPNHQPVYICVWIHTAYDLLISIVYTD